MQRKPIVNNSSVFVGGDSFVQVIDAKVKGIINELKFEIKIINNHTLTLKRIDYELTFFTSANQKINDEPYFVEGSEVNIKAGEIGIADEIDLHENFPNASHAEIKLITAHFDGDNSLDLVYDKMEKMTLKSLTDLERELLKEVAGEDAINLSEEGQENWRCVCGYFNGINSDKCHNCQREKETILRDYSSIDRIKETLEKNILGQMNAIENDKNDEDNLETLTEEVIEESQDEDVEKSFEEVEQNIEIKDFFDSIPKSQMIMLMASGVMLMSSAIIWALLRFN